MKQIVLLALLSVWLALPASPQMKAVPVLLQVGAVTAHGVNLNWSDSTAGGQITGHNIYRSSSAGVCKWSAGTTGSQVVPPGCVKIGSATVTSFVDTSTAVQAEGTKVFYVETATGPGGESASSNEASATIPFQIPAAPTQNQPVSF